MNIAEYLVVAKFNNDSENELCIFLEMTCEEVYLAPSHSIELLAKKTDNLLPISVSYSAGVLQVHPHREFDPDWYIRFKGKIIKPSVTRLSELES